MITCEEALGVVDDYVCLIEDEMKMYKSTDKDFAVQTYFKTMVDKVKKTFLENPNENAEDVLDVLYEDYRFYLDIVENDPDDDCRLIEMFSCAVSVIESLQCNLACY